MSVHESMEIPTSKVHLGHSEKVSVSHAQAKIEVEEEMVKKFAGAGL